VHTAVAMGCEKCHHVSSENNQTTITLVATGGTLCAMCHETRQDAVLHGPYKAGQCLICHSPHSGEHLAQTRAEPDTLCLSCHGFGRQDVKVNTDTQVVTLPGGQTLSLDEYRQAPKLGSGRPGAPGHPVMEHPLGGSNPRTKDANLSCLSCHDPHVVRSNSTPPAQQ
jgi:predicted CXXCH cytochrome family protein